MLKGIAPLTIPATNHSPCWKLSVERTNSVLWNSFVNIIPPTPFLHANEFATQIFVAQEVKILLLSPKLCNSVSECPPLGTAIPIFAFLISGCNAWTIIKSYCTNSPFL